MCLVPRQPRSRRDSRARRHVNRVVAHQCGILLGPEKERSIATRPLGPLLSPRHLIDASPLESPSTHSVFSGGGPRVQPPQKGAAGVYQAAGGRDAGHCLQRPKVRWDSCRTRLCRSLRLRTDGIQASNQGGPGYAAGPAGSSPRQGRGDGRGREGPEGARGKKELGQARAALLEATFYWSGEDQPLENWEPQRPCHGLNPGPQKVGPHPDPQCP